MCQTSGKGPLGERGNLPSWATLFVISNKGSFICTISDRIAPTKAFVYKIMELWLEWEIVQSVHHEGLIWQPITPWVDNLPWSYILVTETSVKVCTWSHPENTLYFLISLAKSYELECYVKPFPAKTKFTFLY